MEYMSNNLSNTGTDSADFDWADFSWELQEGGSLFDWKDDSWAEGGCAQ